MVRTMPASLPAARRSRTREHYEIEYGRFFNYPTFPAGNSALLKPLPKPRKLRLRGTWLSSPSTASLNLFSNGATNTQSHAQLVLVISLNGTIYEEHFISKLHFSWPQVSSASQHLVRGSRVVFASYGDCVGQIQKFAIRFSNSSESQTFISFLKESLKVANYIGMPCGSFRSEILPGIEFISANAVHDRAGGEKSNENLAGNYPPLIQYPSNDRVQLTCSEEPTNPHDCQGTWAPLPPSFTLFLADDLTEAQHETPSVAKEVDLKTYITTYMPASSFNDMLSKLEGFISDLGGDLSL